MNKTRLFDENLVKHLVSAAKVISILIDFTEKMEELLDEMRGLFDGLQPEGPPIVALENLPNLSREILSLTRWGRDTVPTKTPTKSNKSGLSEPTKDT